MVFNKALLQRIARETKTPLVGISKSVGTNCVTVPLRYLAVYSEYLNRYLPADEHVLLTGMPEMYIRTNTEVVYEQS